MITDVIVDELDGAIEGLTKGVTLFAETGMGAKYVTVKTTYPHPLLDDATDFRRTTFQVLVRGWSTGKCHNIAEQIIQILKDFSGDRLVTNSLGDVESYRVKAVNYHNGPIPVEWDGNHGSTINFAIVYSFSII